MERPLLYDLHEIKEWDPVEEEVKIPSNFSLLNWVPGYAKRGVNDDGLILPSWEVKISLDETRFAILSNSFVEVYSVPDKLLGRSKPFEEPMSKDIVWSEGSDYFVIPSSTGKKFYLFDGFSAHCLYCMSSPSWSGSSLIFTGFMKSSLVSTWEGTLLSISDKGKAISFLIGKTGFQEESKHFSFAVKNPCAALYTKKYNLIVIAHWESGLYVLGVWRPLNEEPFFQKVETHTEGTDVHPILKMSLSICESKLATLDSEGTLKVYTIPTLSLVSINLLEEQPLYDEINPSLLTDPKLLSRKNNFLGSSIKWHPYKVEWWDKDALIISRYSGSVSIITVEGGKESQNLLGDSVEFFSDIPSITPRFGKYILCLERDYQSAAQEPSENDAQSKQWFWGLPEKAKSKTLISTYRLIAMVKMTPEELYQRKIDKEEYGEALVLADAFGLDGDLVYLRRWHLSDYSVHAQNDFLYKVSNKRSITQECLDTVPNNINDAKELLQFGLKTAQPDTDLENKFKRYVSLLKTYERLVRCFARQEIKFNAQFFIKFRESSIEESIRKFAQLGYWDAIRVIFEMHFEEIAGDYIGLLSSFPDSYSPLEYSFILPYADFKSKEVIYPFGSCADKLSYDALQRWYRARSLALEEATGLPDNALDLLKFANLHGVQMEEELLQDFCTLRTLIYDLGKGCLNYGLFKKMSPAEKVEEFILASSESGERVLVSSRISEYLLPFLEAQETLREGSINAILKAYFSRSRPRDVSFDKEIIFNLPERRVKDPQFISFCLESLFKLNDEYEVLCEILLLFMEHSQMDQLLEVYTIMNINVITRKYGYAKSMEIGSQDYKDEKYIDSIIMDLCRNVNFLQHIESPDLCTQALEDVFTICKGGNASTNLESYFKSTLVQLLQSENAKVVGLLVDACGCSGNCGGNCFYHRSLLTHDLTGLSPSEKQGMLLSTAEFYLRSSHFIGDHNVSLAELCLAEAPSEVPRVKRMRDVLRLGYLLHNFAMSVPPAELLDLKNGREIISELLLKNKNNYKRPSDILAIASLLSSEKSFGQDVEAMIAEHSLESGDVRSALTLVRNMIAQGYEPAGDICFRILQLAPHLSIEDRECLTGFCLQFGCPEHVLALLDKQESVREALDLPPSKEDLRLTYDYSSFPLHPFYDPQPRLTEQTSLWTLSLTAIRPENMSLWLEHLLAYDILAGVSLLSSLNGECHLSEERDEKNHLFIKAYAASLMAFSPTLRSDTVQLPPKTLIAAAVCEARTQETPHPISPVLARFDNYIEARRLSDLDANIDVARFVNEEAYKRDTILGLSMSSDVQCFNLAMKYAQDNDSIDPWELCLNFLRCLFTDNLSGLQSVLENNPKVTKTLVKEPERLQSALEKYIYGSLDGRDYEGLLVYFRLQQSLGLLPEARLRLLKKLVSKAKALNTSSTPIDLKDLLGGESRVGSTLKGLLSDSSSLGKVLPLVEVLASVNPHANTGLLYQSLCEKTFESGMSKGLSMEQIFEQCEEHLRKMSGSTLKEFVVSVSFKSPSISLTFSEREAFFRRLQDLPEVVTGGLLDCIHSWMEFNDQLRALPKPQDEGLLFELGGTLGSDCRGVLVHRLVEGTSSFRDLIPAIESLTSSSKENVFKEALIELLHEDRPLKTLESLLCNFEEDLGEEISDILLDWCSKSGGSDALGKKDFVIDFVRGKSQNWEALNIVSLHKSRLILSEGFPNAEELLPNLDNKVLFLQKAMEAVEDAASASAILNLICFWEEETDSKFLESKRQILEFIIRRKIAIGFSSELDKFSLDQMVGLEGLLEACYEAGEVRFAYVLLRHCSAFNEELKGAVGCLEEKYPLSLGKDHPQDLPSCDYVLPFSLWMRASLKV